jgi:hypothetical protein
MAETEPFEGGVPSAPPAGPGAPGTPSGGSHSAAPGSVPPATPQPAEAIPQAGQAFGARARELAAVCLGYGRRLAVWLWDFLSDVAKYYWGVRRALREYVAGFAPNLMPEAQRMREVRLAPYESHSLAEYDAVAGWKIAVPGRCVVCGEKTANPQMDENLSIDDAARAFWVPVATVLVGVPLGLFLFGRWSVLFVLPLSFVMGYLLRAKAMVLSRVARCDAHQLRTNIPQILVWGSTLVVRFGHKSVRRVFLYGETMDSAVPAPDAAAFTPPIVDAHIPATPETIPLADAPLPEESTIRHEQPLSFRPEDEDSSSKTVS